jgi:hypothetical protein
MGGGRSLEHWSVRRDVVAATVVAFATAWVLVE